MQKLHQFKLRRWLRFYCRAWFGLFIAPAKSYEGFKAAIFIVIAVVAAVLAVRANVVELSEGIAIALGPFLLFLLWCSIAAYFKVSKDEKEKGERHGNKFVYHEPFLIRTVNVSPKDNGTRFDLKSPEFEPGTLATFKIESENRGDFLIKVGIGGPKQKEVLLIHIPSKIGIRIGPEKTLNLITDLTLASLPR